MGKLPAWRQFERSRPWQFTAWSFMELRPVTNEEIVARLEELNSKLLGLETENSQLREKITSSDPGPGPGVGYTLDSALGDLRGRAQFARSVTIATRPVQDNPSLYPNATFTQARPPEGQKRGSE